MTDESVRESEGNQGREGPTEDSTCGATFRGGPNRRERQTEKEAVAAERRSIKKSARRHLKKALQAELEHF